MSDTDQEKYLKAIFAIFSEDGEPEKDDIDTLKTSGINASAEVLANIIGSSDGTPKGVAYCKATKNALLKFVLTPQAYIDSLPEGDPRKVVLIDIHAAASGAASPATVAAPPVTAAPPAPAAPVTAPAPAAPATEPVAAPTTTAVPPPPAKPPKRTSVKVGAIKAPKVGPTTGAKLPPPPPPTAADPAVDAPALPDPAPAEAPAPALKPEPTPPFLPPPLDDFTLSWTPPVRPPPRARPFSPTTQLKALRDPAWAGLYKAATETELDLTNSDMAVYNKAEKDLKWLTNLAAIYASGQAGEANKCVGELLQCMLKDLEEGLHLSNSPEFESRYRS